MQNINTSYFTEWLNKFINFQRNLNKDIQNLDKMNKFAAFFNNPHLAYKNIHIAGSKGKGSTSIMISSILKEAGLLTGLYTSPHVMDFRERISCAGTFFSDETYSKTYKKIIEGFETIIKNNPLSDPGWFEIVTMTAFLLFQSEQMEIAVIETGLGGRLDMTNILVPEATVLTPIELEHCKYLGNTIEKIAFEKAGIIKKGKPVFCSKQKPEALKVFKEKAKETNSDFFYLPEILESHAEFKTSKEGLEINIAFKKDNPVGKLFKRAVKTKLKLIDEIQAENAALAACTVKYLFPNIDESILEKGLAKAWLPARFEILLKNPLIVIDGAHTKNSLELCINTYRKLNSKKGTLIFACADDKDTKEIAPLFKNIFKKIILTIPGTFKKSNIDYTYNDFKNVFTGCPEIPEKNEDYKGIIRKTLEECIKTNSPLLITGSFYLAAEAKTIYGGLNCN